MALSFPLSIDDFFGDLRVRQIEVDLPDTLVTSRTAGGGIAVDSIADRLWTATVRIAGGYNLDLEAVRAKLSILREADRSLLVYPKQRPFPRNDPAGAALGAAIPRIASLASNNRELTISDLPAGYVITAGDYLSFQYGANPVRYGFYQVVVGAVADAGGLTGQIEVTPHIRPGATVGSVVALARPVFKGVLVPGSVSVGTSDPRVGAGPAFKLIQTFR